MSEKKLTIRCAMATKFVRMSNMLFAFATQVLHLYLHVWQVNDSLHDVTIHSHVSRKTPESESACWLDGHISKQ